MVENLATGGPAGGLGLLGPRRRFHFRVGRGPHIRDTVSGFEALGGHGGSPSHQAEAPSPQQRKKLG